MSFDQLKTVFVVVGFAMLFVCGGFLYYCKKRTLKLITDWRRIKARNSALLRSVRDLLLIVSRKGGIMDFRNISDHPNYLPTTDLAGRMIVEILPDKIARNLLHYIDRAVDNHSIQRYEYRLDHNGNEAHYEAQIIPSGKNEVLIIIRGLTERKQMEEAWEFLSLRDSLTGLHNRRYFEREILRLNTTSASFSGIVVCDIDGLKFINDTLGHPAGDDLIKTVAHLIRSCFRSIDVVARIGGDEFAVIVCDAEPEVVAHASARINKTVAEHNKANNNLPVSVSVGWSIPTETSRKFDALFMEADGLMYREKLRNSEWQKKAVVEAIIAALEVRDYITEGHGERLKDIVVWMAQKVGLSEASCRNLRLFSKFHDIGKVGIPDAILFKPAKLLPEEYSIMQQHCEIGYRIAQAVPELMPIAELILRHHEWWNGGGYPLKLQGEEIPVECRILALADAYDAMTNDRPYHKAMSYEEALQELRSNAGKQFDPVLTELFIALIVNQVDPVI
ncbi:HD domain-containing phosphohydrolase [Sporomusa sp. GT1]|uniref:bifunctional diguanylate cyclase/phosphohydrolase n=1 Tax=Sporomusa sp. GT1 TaxID=1534747 RepID=UPI0016689080|nr:HD domain-containing phosphohydrolase [Sporomusa sp. GT1]